ncbi:hypothetical protein LCGC14_0906720 [marine sediment metagenome]|uniref:Uncharacterized protein n=1 Tax=marine sediment metagenome TaxID=412755 RepID=A0A0F9S1P9_9ZZZZ
MTWTETLGTVVPAGKHLVWLVGFGVSMFLAGIGFFTQVGELPQLPERMGAVETIQARQEFALDSLRNGQRRIVCLVRLSATGQTVDPLEIDRVCP